MARNLYSIALPKYLHVVFKGDHYRLDDAVLIGIRASDGDVTLFNDNIAWGFDFFDGTADGNTTSLTKEQILRHVMENVSKQLAIIELEKTNDSNTTDGFVFQPPKRV